MASASKPARSKKKLILLLVKVAFSLGVLWYVYRGITAREGADELVERIGSLSLGWWALAAVMQLGAISLAIVRWRVLLGAQGIVAPYRFLIGSFFIGRFWGAFTPGGFGLDGWRLYDVASRTDKIARATAVAGVEKILGQLGFGLVVMGCSVWGAAFVGTEGVLLVNAFFVVLVSIGMTVLAKPQLVRKAADFLPGWIKSRLQTLVDAVCAYHGKGRLVAMAVLLSAGVHTFNNLIYVCAARALGIDLSVGMVFFASSLQIMATLVPVSINGVGLREAAALALYTSAAVGLSRVEAVLIADVGFVAEMFISGFGALPFLLRRGGYRADIIVEDPDRENAAHAAIEVVAPEKWPRRLRGLTLGLGAGLLAGVFLGAAEGLVVVTNAGGRVGLGVLPYGAVAYGLFCGLGGAVFGVFLAWTGRLMKREALPESKAYAQITAFILATMVLALGAFRIRRDIFHEELVWKSPKGLLLLLACGLAAVLIYFAVSAALRRIVTHKSGAVMLRAWGSPAVLAGLVGSMAIASLLLGQPGEAAEVRERPAAPEGAGNILFIVVDTLRADHLPAYGYEAGSTPNLDAFAQDAVRFDQAFANSSWTRPSFASFLTGRYPSSHGVMAKSDQLPEELVTLPEALQGAGYFTGGFVTNYNVAPFFNFQQGFDEYRYLEPDYVLGADDAASKLLLVQFLRQRIETFRAKRGTVLPGTAYQDAETVNREAFAWLEREPGAPWFLFAAYMDPHDPYFEHPYTGNGYSRAAHQHPEPEEASDLRRLYDREIVYWDEHFGALVDDLKQRGLYDDMTIIVSSDHGEEFHEHGGFWHGTTLYDEQVHVPLFVKLPKARRGGTVVRHWVQNIDVMPTVLNQLGVDLPEGVQGGDLFEGTDLVYAEESHEGNVLESVRQRRGTDEWKLIMANPGNPRGLDPIELYRPDNDPEERADLAADVPAEVRVLTEALIEAGAAAHEGAVERTTVEVDEAAADRLRNLGYAVDE